MKHSKISWVDRTSWITRIWLKRSWYWSENSTRIEWLKNLCNKKRKEALCRCCRTSMDVVLEMQWALRIQLKARKLKSRKVQRLKLMREPAEISISKNKTAQPLHLSCKTPLKLVLLKTKRAQVPTRKMERKHQEAWKWSKMLWLRKKLKWARNCRKYTTSSVERPFVEMNSTRTRN